MSSQSTTGKQPPKTLAERQEWWNQLTDLWKKAFNETMLNKGPVTDMPDEEGFTWILEAPNLRFAGPNAFYPNMTFELTDLTGLSVFHLTTLISVTNHQITDLEPIAHLTGLTSLFVNGNAIENLDPIKDLVEIKTLFLTDNKITSLKALEKMTKLFNVQCAHNKLESFEGIHAGNTKDLENFVGLPNRVTQIEIDRLQNDLRVRVIKM
ncbi:MAG: hypothetical protein AAFZ15_30580 [Bacteroidota bacterium]